MGVYCRRCKYSLISGDKIMGCLRILRPSKINPYTEEVERETEYVSLSENKKGECPYYAPIKD